MSDLILTDALFTAHTKLIKNHRLWEKPLIESLRFVVEICSEALNVKRVSVWQRSLDIDGLHCTILYSEGKIEQPLDLQIFQSDHEAYFAALDSQRVVAAGDAVHNEFTKSFAQDYLIPLGIGALLDVTFLRQGKTVGIVCIEDGPAPREWTSAEIAFASAIGDYVSQLLLRHALTDSENRYRAVFDGISDALILIRDNQIVDFNAQTLTLFGCEQSDILFQSPAQFWPTHQPDGQPSIDKIKTILTNLDENNPVILEWRNKTIEGKEFDSEVKINLLKLDHNEHFIVCIRDISHRKQLEAKSHQLSAQSHAVLNGAPCAIIATDEEGIITEFNHYAERLLGYTAEEVIQRRTPCIFHEEDELHWRSIELSEELGEDISSHWQTLTGEVKADNTTEHEWTYVTKSKHRFPALVSITSYERDNDTTGYVFIATDLSDRKKVSKLLRQSKAELEYKASHDDLTHLPNRTELHKRTKLRIEERERKKNQSKLALALLDINQFKAINDALGHSFGDRLLIQIAEDLKELARIKKFSVFRLGGDEFALLIDQVHSSDQLIRLCKDIHDCLAKPQKVDQVDIEVSASIGVAVYPEHGDNSHSLLRCADVAMYRAKVTGGYRTELYAADNDLNSANRLAMMSELGTAIRNNELVLYYQPKIDPQNQSCTGCEALVRWVHPKRGFIPPNDFIPLAEMSDLIHSLSLWVLEEAVRQLQVWQKRNLDLRISINFSTKNLVDMTLPQFMKDCLNQYEVKSENLRIEITETALMQDPKRVLTVIEKINELGVHFEIDDFGTGYSSLSHLKRLPIKTLKIDRSFIKDLLTDEQDHAIVRSTLDLAHSFGLSTVAEGVEDQETVNALQEMGCDFIQGFYYCKPLPANEFESWVIQFNQKQRSTHKPA